MRADGYILASHRRKLDVPDLLLAMPHHLNVLQGLRVKNVDRAVLEPSRNDLAVRRVSARSTRLVKQPTGRHVPVLGIEVPHAQSAVVTQSAASVLRLGMARQAPQLTLAMALHHYAYAPTLVNIDYLAIACACRK